jgi:NitT/TauT family transport system substrate-binding protein
MSPALLPCAWRRVLVGGTLPALLAAALGLAACAPAPAPTASPGAAPPAVPAASNAAPSAPGAPPAPARLDKVVLGMSSRQLGNLPIYLAQTHGLFAAEGLDVEVITARTDVTIAALVAGEIDYTSAINTSIAAIVGGSPLVVVFSLQEKPLIYLVSRPEVTDANSLRGGVVGHGGTRGTHWQATVAMVRSLGLDPAQDVQLLSTGDVEKGVAMLLSGAAAAVTLTPPYDSIAVKDGYHRLVDAGEVMESLPETGLVAPRGKLSRDPEQIRRMVRGILKGVRYLRDHQDDATALIQKDWDLDRETARLAAQSMIPVFNPRGEVPDQALQSQLDNGLREAGIASTDLTVKDLADWTFVREVRQGLQP